jgi:hypothetical protein
MIHWDSSSPTSVSVILCYGLAGLSIVIALDLALRLGRGFDVRSALFLTAIAVSAWCAGMRPDPFFAWR